MEEVCANCKFSRKSDDEDLLLCHRYPPQIIGEVVLDKDGSFLYEESIALFPTVLDDEYCGEFKRV
jgi:hypothetical protein